jgi:hypothetical protein
MQVAEDGTAAGFAALALGSKFNGLKGKEGVAEAAAKLLDPDLENSKSALTAFEVECE